MVKKLLTIGMVVGSVLATPFSHTRSNSALASSSTRYSYIAFTVWQEGTSDIYVMTPDGTQWANLTHTPDAIEQFPTWSPDGSQIAFISDNNSGMDIYATTTERNSTTRQLTHDVELLGGPVWSSTGQQIAFVAYNYQIALISATGDRIAVFAPWMVEDPITWSPDGRYIAYASTMNEKGEYMNDYDIFVFDVDANLAAMTSESSPVPAWFPEAPLNAFPPINTTNTPNVDEYAPSWSPDGGYFAFLRGHSGSVYVMGIDGSSPRLLPSPADNGGYPPPVSGWPTWAPDGKQVAFTSNVGKVYGNDLYIASVEGTRLKRVTHLPEEQGVRIAEPAWSPWLDEPLDLDWQPTPWSVSEE